jgi:hypothetical protein
MLSTHPSVRCILWWGPCTKGHFIHAGSLDPEFFFFFCLSTRHSVRTLETKQNMYVRRTVAANFDICNAYVQFASLTSQNIVVYLLKTLYPSYSISSECTIVKLAMYLTPKVLGVFFIKIASKQPLFKAR